MKNPERDELIQFVLSHACGGSRFNAKMKRVAAALSHPPAPEQASGAPACQACGAKATHRIGCGTDHPGYYCEDCGPFSAKNLAATPTAEPVGEAVSGPLALLIGSVAALEREEDGGWSPDARSNLRRIRMATNWLSAPPAAPEAAKTDRCPSCPLAIDPQAVNQAQPKQQAQAGELITDDEIYKLWPRPFVDRTEAKTFARAIEQRVMQSHREAMHILQSNVENYERNIDTLLNRECELLDAISKDRTALQACLDGLKLAAMYSLAMDTKDVNDIKAAITKAKEALK